MEYNLHTRASRAALSVASEHAHAAAISLLLEMNVSWPLQEIRWFLRRLCMSQVKV